MRHAGQSHSLSFHSAVPAETTPWQLRKLLEELKTYTPPLDLLAKLSPDAPLLAREALKAEKEGRGASWWKGLTGTANGKEGQGPTERERALVRVLSGEEELEALTTPKVCLGLSCPFPLAECICPLARRESS